MKNKLWTKNFTIITLGSVVSMLGNSVAGFAIGLFVLDKTESTLLYALTMVCYALPKIVLPLVAGTYLDRFSRKKVIYTLDFTSAAVFLLIFLMIRFGSFSYALALIFTSIAGSIDSIYYVAYDSFYPTLVSEGNFSKAYSISSMIYPLAAVMVPVAAFVYGKIGVAPLFLFNAVTFLIAAIFETRIDSVETHIKKTVERFSVKAFTNDFLEGMRYIISEKGLLAVTIYFSITEFCSATGNLILPYFRSAPGLGVQLYTYVMAFAVIGRLVGGTLQYRFKYPARMKFAIALIVYITIDLLSGIYLYLPSLIMMIVLFITGILGVTSYNIRISSTQSYIPDGVRGRYNGSFQMLCSLGGVLGQLTSGVIAEFIGERPTILILMLINSLAVFLIVLPAKSSIKNIYNREV